MSDTSHCLNERKMMKISNIGKWMTYYSALAVDLKCYILGFAIYTSKLT